MKTVINLALFVSLTCLLNSCGCNKDCPDCHELDEETCECIPQYPCLCANGVLDEGEEEIDCGGNCDPCFECLSNYCTILSGGTTDQPVTHKKWFFEKMPSNTMDFKSTGTVVWNIVIGTGFGTWEFDNADSPTVIIVDIESISGSMGEHHRHNEFGIDSISADILIVNWDGKNTLYPE